MKPIIAQNVIGHMETFFYAPINLYRMMVNKVNANYETSPHN